MIGLSRQAPPAPLDWSVALRNQLQQSRLFADMTADSDVRRVGVCACHAGAGATTVAYNLAVMLHERSGEPVVLVEGNLRRPALARLRGIGTGPGFAAFARGEDVAGVVLRDASQPGISLLPATAEALPLPVLRAAAERLPGLGQHFRHVVVDLPPVLDYPDAALLGAVLDGVVVVVEAETTRWQVAREAAKRLEAGGVKLLGAVLNKKPHVIPDWLYRLL
ncbi:Putative tyrosine-protein kinase YveL [Burkholderiaceae bacterium]|nr:Putative tyrosine-protein kinase YveL [Burkholderiaceae bacterium]